MDNEFRGVRENMCVLHLAEKFRKPGRYRLVSNGEFVWPSRGLIIRETWEDYMCIDDQLKLAAKYKLCNRVLPWGDLQKICGHELRQQFRDDINQAMLCLVD